MAKLCCPMCKRHERTIEDRTMQEYKINSSRFSTENEVALLASSGEFADHTEACADESVEPESARRTYEIERESNQCDESALLQSAAAVPAEVQHPLYRSSISLESIQQNVQRRGGQCKKSMDIWLLTIFWLLTNLLLEKLKLLQLHQSSQINWWEYFSEYSEVEIVYIFEHSFKYCSVGNRKMLYEICNSAVNNAICNVKGVNLKRLDAFNSSPLGSYFLNSSEKPLDFGNMGSHYYIVKDHFDKFIDKTNKSAVGKHTLRAGEVAGLGPCGPSLHDAGVSGAAVNSDASYGVTASKPCKAHENRRKGKKGKSGSAKKKTNKNKSKKSNKTEQTRYKVVDSKIETTSYCGHDVFLELCGLKRGSSSDELKRLAWRMIIEQGQQLRPEHDEYFRYKLAGNPFISKLMKYEYEEIFGEMTIEHKNAYAVATCILNIMAKEMMPYAVAEFTEIVFRSLNFPSNIELMSKFENEKLGKLLEGVITKISLYKAFKSPSWMKSGELNEYVKDMSCLFDNRELIRDNSLIRYFEEGWVNFIPCLQHAVRVSAPSVQMHKPNATEFIRIGDMLFFARKLGRQNGVQLGERQKNNNKKL
jgi:hypothetical protein